MNRANIPIRRFHITHTKVQGNVKLSKLYGESDLQIMENSSRIFSEIFIFRVVTQAVLLENSSIRIFG